MTDESTQLPVRLPKDTYDALKAMASVTDRSMTDIVTTVQQYLDTEGRAALLTASVEKARTRYRAVLDELA